MFRDGGEVKEGEQVGNDEGILGVGDVNPDARGKMAKDRSGWDTEVVEFTECGCPAPLGEPIAVRIGDERARSGILGGLPTG